MKKITILFFLISVCFAQNNDGFDFDYGIFGYDQNSNIIEFYYSINSDYLQKSADQSQNYTGQFNIIIKDKKNSGVVASDTFNLDFPVSGTQKSFVGILKYKLPEGKYVYKLNISSGTFSAEYIDSFRIEPLLSAGKISISDIQLSSKILQGFKDTTSIYYKNTLEVIPNAQGIAYSAFPVIFYYAEIYNINPGETYSIKKSLLDANGNILNRGTKEFSSNGNSRVEIGQFNLSKLNSGRYTLSLSVTDSTNIQGVVSLKNFYYINPDKMEAVVSIDDEKGYLTTEYGVMVDEECDYLFNYMKYIASKNEISKYEDLTDLDAKRKFLYDFWLKRDPVPATPINEYKEEYLRRISKANEKFGSLSHKGAATARGRVLCVYGNPDQVDPVPNDINYKPYEIWYYNSIEGGVIFVFADIYGYNEYELIHSTKRGELRDDQWTRRITSH